MKTKIKRNSQTIVENTPSGGFRYLQTQYCHWHRSGCRSFSPAEK